MKDLTKKPAKPDKKNRRRQQEEAMTQQDNMTDNIELDVNLHCRDLSVRELEFTMVWSNIVVI